MRIICGSFVGSDELTNRGHLFYIEECVFVWEHALSMKPNKHCDVFFFISLRPRNYNRTLCEQMLK